MIEEFLKETRRIDRDTVERTYADGEGNVTVRRTYDPNRALEEVGRARLWGGNRGPAGRKVASIPLEVLEHERQMTGFDFLNAEPAEQRAWLERPENSLWRLEKI